MSRFNFASRAVAMTLATLLCAPFAWAADAPAKAAPVTKESREQMAQAHEKMATCLRSDRDMGDCRKEMMQACEHQMAGGACGMMHEGKMPMHKHQANKPATGTAPTKP